MSVNRTIAWRFLLRGTDKGRLSPMTVFAWLAIAIGVAAMCSLLAVMYGFEASLKEKVLKAYPHVIVGPRDSGSRVVPPAELSARLRGLPGVSRAVPYLEAEMIVSSPRRTVGAVVWGVPAAELESYARGLQEGRLPKADSRIGEVLVGSELAGRLGIVPGQLLKVVSPTDRAGAMGLAPRAETFEVAGVFSSGHYDFDQQYLFMMIEDAQDLLKAGVGVSGWQVWGQSIEQAEDIQAGIAAILPEGLQAQSWAVFNSALFHSLKLEQYAMFSVLVFAVLIAVMNVVITLLMHVTHKRKNIGVLRALGASARDVRRIFAWQGMFLGGVGLLLGAVLFVAFIVYVRNFSHFQLPDIYYDRSIPVEIRPVSIALTLGVTVVLIFLATWYPSRRAAEVDPIEAIRE